ncbi:hypothetical protein SB6421_01591 [Klebsiella huaxiensis]|uniref:hypothetical protein n=1 Tax=Klebsiella huaxiensis TaxID=2153354 RepID=UPI00115C2D47|nr:hypothetical protein [Klebsiella huaxiensis]VUT16875.1 hypothetical protein SB6421_01591 [Klebsiella huaxiensis]
MNIETVNELIQSLESAGELSIKETKVMALAKAYLDVAAENVALKNAIECHKAGFTICEACGEENGSWNDDVCKALDDTTATDRIVTGIKADGRIEGINFAAGRLAAAFNHGFVDKSMAEVYDVVRMILTAKEDLASNPAEDGLSGEYAEKSLAEWEVVLREGADK